MNIDFFILSSALIFLVLILFIGFIKGSKFQEKLLALLYIELLICIFIIIYGTFYQNEMLINISLIFSLMGFIGIIFLSRLQGDEK